MTGGPKPEEEALRTRRSKKMVAHQAGIRDNTVALIAAGKAEVEKLIENGTYPNSRVTQIDVLKRARVGGSTLKNPTHADTRSSLKTWLSVVNTKLALQKVGVEKQKRELSLQTKLEHTCRQLDITKLLLEDTQQALLAAESRANAAEAAVARSRSNSFKIV